MAGRTLYRWHKRIGLVVFTAIIAWALSGLSHPIMSRVNPRPVFMQPPVSTAAITKLAPLSIALSANGINVFEQAQVLNIKGQSLYRVEHDGIASYIHAGTGQKAELDDVTYAQDLARYYLGDEVSQVSSVELITTFNEDYLYINRLLPVYKVTFDRSDNMRAYVEVSTGRLATLVDDRKAFVGWVFRQLHSWVFIPYPWVRTIAMSAVLLAGMGLSLVGLWMFWWARSKNTSKENLSRQSQVHSPTRVWHGRLGISFGMLILTFSFSGLYHLLNKPVVPRAALPLPQSSFNAQALTLDWSVVALASKDGNFNQGNFVQVGGSPYLRMALAVPPVTEKAEKPAAAQRHSKEHHSNKRLPKGEEIIYINAKTSQACPDCERRHALDLAVYYAGLTDAELLNAHKDAQVEEITRFSQDYGFLNKRMPVHAVQLDSNSVNDIEPQLTVYVETATGALASRTNASSKREAWSFSYLHKWQFLDPLSKTLRDVLLIAATLAITLLCLLGVWISYSARSDPGMR